MGMGTELSEDRLGSAGAQRKDKLAERDEQMLKLIKQGIEMGAIASRLGISRSTCAGRARSLGYRYDPERGAYRYVDPKANAGVVAARC